MIEEIDDAGTTPNENSKPAMTTAESFAELHIGIDLAQLGKDVSEITMIVCPPSEIPFDQNGDCISCGEHDDDPGWCCLKCGEYVPDILPEN